MPTDEDLQISFAPATRQSERRPEKRMSRIVALLPRGDAPKLCLTQRFRLALAPGQFAVEVLHEQGRLVIGHLPQTREDPLGAGQLERLPQSRDSFAAADIAQAGI